MNQAEAIAELARRQLALEARITKLERSPATTENVQLPAFPGDEGLAGQGATGAGLPNGATPPASVPLAMWEENGELVFAGPTDEQRKQRERLAPHIGFEHWRITTPEQGGEGSVPLPEDEAIAAYVEGGPLWLYHYDRTYVRSLGPEIRVAMVKDVHAVNPEQAHDLARDLLKDESPGEDPEYAIEKDKQLRAHHGGSTGAEPARGGNIGE